MQQDFASETTAIQPALVVSVVYTIGLVKEVQTVYRLFLVNWYTYCMYLGFLPSQLTMWEVEWLIELAWQYIAMTRNNLSIIWISLAKAFED